MPAKAGISRLVAIRSPDGTGRLGLLKAWKRDWKIELVETLNPTWRDLYDALA